MDERNIVLLGFMGTGKSTAARRVAQRLGRVMVDMDAVIEERAGKTITAIFAEEGEPHFRRLERALVRELARQSGLVIAAGGGVVLNPLNLRDFARRGLVVCLTARPAVILRRVGAARHRPLLEGDAKARKILDLLAARRKLYKRLPHRIDTSRLTPAAVARRILDLYAASAEPPP